MAAQASGGTYGDYGQDAYLYSFSGNLTSRAGRAQSYADNCMYMQWGR